MNINNLRFNPLNYPICFDKPLKISGVSAWHEHIPFAFFLIQILKPKIFVELGVFKGDSYLAFCQSINKLQLNTKSFGIDTWKGDRQTGYYTNEIFEILKKYHDPLYGNFSTLINDSFDNALEQFAEGSIDLLHIDGFHTYEAVKNDTDKWLSKMSTAGILLLHDINEYKNGFEVWHLWEEMKDKYPSFEFMHGRGLGILTIGKTPPKDFLNFLEEAQRNKNVVSKFFFSIGNRTTLFQEINNHNDRILNLEHHIRSQDMVIAERISQIKEKDSQIYAIINSNGWRLLTEVNKFAQIFFPKGSLRKRFFNKFLNILIYLLSILFRCITKIYHLFLVNENH